VNNDVPSLLNPYTNMYIIFPLFEKIVSKRGRQHCKATNVRTPTGIPNIAATKERIYLLATKTSASSLWRRDNQRWKTKAAGTGATKEEASKSTRLDSILGKNLIR
jgi:hypothetical protein